jgi:hypothetical protein
MDDRRRMLHRSRFNQTDSAYSNNHRKSDKKSKQESQKFVPNLMVGSFNHLEKYESQWEGLSHILWKINKMFETTNQFKYIPFSWANNSQIQYDPIQNQGLLGDTFHTRPGKDLFWTSSRVEKKI